MRLAVPKAYVTLVADAEPSAETALSILAYARGRLAPYKRVRRLEFGELPKTISGKIRRVELRDAETERLGPGGPSTLAGVRGIVEFWEEDFPGLKG
jgi:acetyl-CoA synthetase